MLTLSQLVAARKTVLDQFEATEAPSARARAEKCVSSGIIASPNFPDASLEGGEAWSDRGARSHERYLHGFLFFADWFGTVFADESQRDAAADAALSIVRSWAAVTQNAPASMAYHDETTAQRLIKLLQLDLFLAQSVPQQTNSFLRPLMNETADLLAKPDFHSTGNNHGMFQDLALLYYSVLADWQLGETRIKYFELSLTRLRAYFDSCYTSDGVHVENTPTYHVLVSRYLALVQEVVKVTGHSDAGHYVELLKKAEVYAIHAIMPNGVFPPLSDTQQKRMNGKNTRKTFPSQDFLYAATGGMEGTKPTSRTLVLPNSGYAIYRSEWGNPKSTFAFFSAAYNADYHKHSDDLSLYLRSQGIDLLSESGPYSYDYKHPFSRYAYSQFSHNSLIVDGTSLPRTDAKASAVSLSVLRESPSGFKVRGSNSRYSDTKHARTLEIDDNSGRPRLSLIDEIESSTDHNYQLLWNLGPDVKAQLQQNGFAVFHGANKVMELEYSTDIATKITVLRGQKKPRPMGWTFPKFGEAKPSEVVSIAFSGKIATIKTEIRLDEFQYTDPLQPIASTDWRSFEDSARIRHLFSPTDTHTTAQTKLAVVFTSPETSDLTHYKRTFETSSVSPLYIATPSRSDRLHARQEEAEQGQFDDSVQALVRAKINELELGKADVAFIGMNERGTQAINHGQMLGADRILMGLYGTNTNSYIDEISSLIQANADSRTKITVATESASDLLDQFANVIGTSAPPPLSAVTISGINNDDRPEPFFHYLRAWIEHWIKGGAEEPQAYSLGTTPGGNDLVLRLFSEETAANSFRLYLGKNVIQSRGYSRDREASFLNLEPGIYRVRVYSRSSDGRTLGSFTTRRISIQ